jgi:hypothetical protein
MFYRNKVINQFHEQFTIVVLVTSSLTTYMTRAKDYAKGEVKGYLCHNMLITEFRKMLV